MSFGVTLQTNCFPCRRYLGRGVDDNSLERLLVPETVPLSEDIVTFTNQILQQSSKK